MKNLIFFVCLLFSITGYSQTGISVSPPKTYFTSAAGESQSQKILVTNPSKSTSLNLTVSLNDWQYDAFGANMVSEPDSLPNSLANWVSIQPQSFFTLAPGESKELEITVTPPQSKTDSLPVHTCMLYITQTNPIDAIDEKGSMIKISVRTGVKIYHRYRDLRNPDIEFIGYKYEKTHQELLLELENIGNVWTDGTITTELINQNDGSKVKLEDRVIYTLPLDKRKVKIALPKDLKPGKYIATSIFSLEENDVIKMAELTFTHE